MRIVIDLQAAQTAASSARGVGRYAMSLTKAMLRRAPQHEFWIVLNERFPASVLSLRKEFESYLPAERIVTFSLPHGIAAAIPHGDPRRQAAALIREAFLRKLEPDHVHISSLFEGLNEDAVASIGESDWWVPTSVTLFDLIPHLFPRLYQRDERTCRWYNRNICSLKRSNLLLAISESSRRDAINHLSFADQAVVTISTAADSQFVPVKLPVERAEALRRRYGLDRRFLLYAGGIDPRKNVDGLIDAFARMPRPIRVNRQLAIVCSVQETTRVQLLAFARSLGLEPDQVILTGFVPDEDLIALYTLCELFVFPSLYEGFGLPILEAMACGAAVLGSNCSSIPEIISDKESLFDPTRPDEIAAKIVEVLSDPQRVEQMQLHGIEQSRSFSWDSVADRAIAAIEKAHSDPRILQKNNSSLIQSRRPRLAYISPLPPLQTGISAYSRDLVLELIKYFQVDLVTDQQGTSDFVLEHGLDIVSPRKFERQFSKYDHVVYNIGNSQFHEYMIDLLPRCPGVVILHDLFLSSLMHWMGAKNPGVFERSLLESHGYPALLEHLTGSANEAIWKYPANGAVIESAAGIIVHSDFARESLIASGMPAEEIIKVEQIRKPVQTNRLSARAALGITPDEFIVCSFGMLGPTKLNETCAIAFSGMRSPGPRRLFFVGPVSNNSDFHSVAQDLSRESAKISITGHVSDQEYDLYLSAADIAVQLRTMTRGETSRAVLDCMASGLPTIVNCEGPVTEYPDACIVKTPRDASFEAIIAAMDALAVSPEAREQIGSAARTYIEKYHHPFIVGQRFCDAFVQLRSTSRASCRSQVLAEIRQVPGFAEQPVRFKAEVARAVTVNQQFARGPRLLVDVSGLREKSLPSAVHHIAQNIAVELMRDPRWSVRVEPVYADSTEGWIGFRSARRFAENVLAMGGERVLGEEVVVEVGAGDVFLDLSDLTGRGANLAGEAFFSVPRARGAKLLFMVYDVSQFSSLGSSDPIVRDAIEKWISTVTQLGGCLLCVSTDIGDEMTELISADIERCQPLPLVCHIPFAAGTETSAFDWKSGVDSLMRNIKEKIL